MKSEAAATGCTQPSILESDVRWTDSGKISNSGGGGGTSYDPYRRKSAKFNDLREPPGPAEARSYTTTTTMTTTPFQSCTVHSRRVLHGVSCASPMITTASRPSPAFRWHRFQPIVLLYIVVAVVLVDAISVVHCDADISGKSGSSSSSSSSSSSTRQISSNSVDPPAGGGVSGSVTKDHYEGSGHYTHHWAVHIPNGDERLVEQVAEEHGFVNLGKILDDYYHFEHRHVQKRSVNPSAHHQRRLDGDDRVRWAKQQRAKSRSKRDFRPLKASYLIQLNDPKWPEMWYLNRGNGLDMNVIPAWKEGVTGKGVVVTILDDGLESDHPDLEHNYDPKASYDVNGNDGDPMPHYDLTDSNRHGTRCAGEVAATANNSKCAVGIAYGARVGGVRMLDGDVTDVVEAKSLGLNSQHIDIYSASWGPDDDGKTVDGPGDMATRAFIEGVRKGRAGKGSIFIWASGNGGREHDNCNCDGYTNSIWTLSISSASQEGLVPWFSEMCSSTLATTYSSGNTNEKQVITTDLHHSCTTSHTGTSASAPLAAGIAALVLEANRNLTWRDMQHIVVRTAKPGNLKDPTWSKNGVGRPVSHSFGYGLMDAAAMVKLARTWKTVPEQQVCEINAPHLDKQIPPRTKVTLQLTVEHCMGVNYLEHVQAKITLTSQRRGDIQIFLTSPSGTRVTLLTPRSHDLSRSGFNQWPFMSVHTWGEAPHGTWQLEIHNEGRLLAQITQWNLIFYGTETPGQPNDPVRLGKPGFSDSNYGGEIEHNSLEFDNGISSDQWRNMQQIGESHVDVQRTASNDVTSVACVSYSLARCIECGAASYFYNGRCYSSCPASTFPSNYPTDRESAIVEQNPLPIGSLRRRRRRRLRWRPESIAAATRLTNGSVNNFNNLDDSLLAAQPQERDTQSQSQPQPRCIPCHPTCLKCIGPEDYHCTECQSGFAFTDANVSPNHAQQRCVSINTKHKPAASGLSGTNKSHPNATSSAPDQQQHDKSWLFTDYLIMITVVGVTLLVAFVVIYLLWMRCFRGVLLANPGSSLAAGISGDYQYNRVQTSEAEAGLLEPSYAQLVRDEIEEILAESSSDDDSGAVFMPSGIIAPMER
ncbi:furin-like protease 1 [Topomyia yanbarensis]|uniref:furin-like protease 1 n=1 Tax=Topomyia yanbarensis TaxID=2498891 RepID=UPI00273C05AB|nr:furin-like protease 1 [Topomyia yanbarensis]XP_058824358.1 furin-like protease 1 [Topomyia yanbarensis]XP_058824359.1 furin-like protease 1 [Topomyia yanbarensis]XP_058824360.1 furin-like protease 1 [Topomyia yanbarensis]XP_058824363.1 furin-like protease 1 [Topomyia yanbarensis]